MNGDFGRVTSAQVRRELARMDHKAGRRRFWIGLIVVLALAFAAGALAARFLFALVDIRTSGMSDSLMSGDVVLCERMDSPLRPLAIERGALALVQYRENGMLKQTIRRVIALGDEEVSVDEEGRVTVDGEALEEPYAAWRSQMDWSGDGEATLGGALENPFAEPDTVIVQDDTEEAPLQADDMNYPLIVPEGQLFVLCDDRENVLDSRSSRFGLVKEADVLGLARLVIWPVHRAALLDAG